MNILNLDEMFELYGNVKDDLKFLIASDVRSKILISLKDGSKNLGHLRREIHLSSSTILHGMYQLEKKDLIFRESGNYSLSQTGEIAAGKLMDLMKSINSLNRCKDLFLNHEIGCIPPYLLKDIGFLNKATIIKSTSTEMTKHHTILSQLLEGTKNFKQLSSVFFPQSAHLLLESLENNGEVHLLFTEEIIHKLSETAGPENLQRWVSSGRLKLGIIPDNTKISFTMADDFIILGLFSMDGAYDQNIFLKSDDYESLFWGKCLFNHYIKNSTEFGL